MLYPNPASESVRLSELDNASEYVVEICNLWGQTVMQFQLNTNTIDISQMNSGVYMLIATNENGKRFQKRLIIE
jgi:hypothetical protein